MSVPIVVDEWLLEDLMGTDPQRQTDAVNFLYKIDELQDKVVILEGSPFEDKMYAMEERSGVSARHRAAYLAFVNLIQVNLNTTLKLTWDDMSDLPEFLVPLIGDTSDHYLFQLYRKLERRESFILTTDGRWNHARLRRSGIRIEMRDEFLPRYLNR